MDAKKLREAPFNLSNQDHKVIEWVSQSAHDAEEQMFVLAGSKQKDDFTLSENELTKIKDHEEEEESKEQSQSKQVWKKNAASSALASRIAEQEGKRGRSAVLEEVEDDDLVNQNSSRSSSKFHSQERVQPQREALASQILQSFSQNSQD